MNKSLLDSIYSILATLLIQNNQIEHQHDLDQDIDITTAIKEFFAEKQLVGNLALANANALNILTSRIKLQSETVEGEKITVSEPLTLREAEILSYASQGYSNKQIANKLCLSEQTIKNHMTNIFHKLDARDRTEAVIMALRNGWIN